MIQRFLMSLFLAAVILTPSACRREKATTSGDVAPSGPKSDLGKAVHAAKGVGASVEQRDAEIGNQVFDEE